MDIQVMVITYHGGGYLKFAVGDDTLLVDPTNQRSVRGASAALFTRHPAPIEFMGTGVPIFSHQGEYEVKGIRITGAAAEHQGAEVEIGAFQVRWDNIAVGIIGPVSKELSAETLLALQGSDILVLPAAAGGKIVRQVEPSVIIPSYVGKETAAFIKELGGASETLDRFTVKKKDLPERAMRVVVLAAQ